MQFLNDMQPFGASFGPAFTRDLCIESSKSLYKRLLSLSPGAIVLPFDVICVVSTCYRLFPLVLLAIPRHRLTLGEVGI